MTGSDVSTFEGGLFAGAASRYSFNPAPESAHGHLLRLLGERSGRGSLLDIGCASGYLAARFNDLGYAVTGLDIDPVTLAEARPFCARVVQADLNSEEWDASLLDSRFEAIVIADVVEHLTQPDRVLQRVRGLLAENGAVYASIPNIAHASVRLHLLSGHFDYAETGLLDRTHLRFFTQATMRAMFERAGFMLDVLERIYVPVSWTNLVYDQRYSPLLERFSLDKEAQTFQFVVRAIPADQVDDRESPLVPAETDARDLSEWQHFLDANRGEEAATVSASHEIALYQQQLDDRTAWARSLEAELAHAREVVAALQSTIDERTSWARELDRELNRVRGVVGELQATVVERTAWAQELDKEIIRLRKSIATEDR